MMMLNRFNVIKANKFKPVQAILRHKDHNGNILGKVNENW